MRRHAVVPAGTSIAGYVVDGVLGRGGMSVVYRASRADRSEPVALKLIEGAAWDEDALTRFEQEARLAAAVAHRNIVPVYDAGIDDGRAFVAMKLETCDLGALLARDGRLPPGRAVRLVSQVASALDVAHTHGLVHRDIKPSNILFGEEEGAERALVADFGVARAAFSGAEPLAGDMVGTIGYASPEQIRGEPVDHRTDVYGLGCLLYECLTGRPPFARTGTLAMLWGHLREEPPLPSLLVPGLPAALDATVARALAKDPRARFGSAGALAEAASDAVTSRQRAAETPALRRELPSGTVTFLFTDVEGSTRLLDAIGPVAYSEALAEHRDIVRAACGAEGGVEVDTQGDAFFFAFPEAPGALRAASVLTDALSATDIRVRVGVHTGTPHRTSEGYVGADVHRAARIAASGHGGQVLVSEQTAALVADDDLVSLGSHRLKDFEAPVRIYQLGQDSFPALKTIANSNLPTPASSFLGREDELREADLLLRSARLLTVHGPGGQGKTRFALELATRAREERFSDYADGVFACFLAPLRDASLVLPTITRTLSLSEESGRSALEVLAEQLRGKRMLLLLDNLEHVLGCAGELAELVRACPELTVLVTTRELLRVQGETPYELPALVSDESVALVCERAQVEPSATLAELAERLEGLPLALELAAARLRLLSPEQLLERLAGRLDLLKGARDADPRQQTLRATIEWSYDLLSPDEQQLFARLSVFVGGCTLDAAEEVCDADLDGLESLLDKSLLRRGDTDAGPRFWMLEMIRELAAERLETSDDADAVRSRHASFFRTALAEPGGLLERHRWMARLEAERDNLRAALYWALEHGTAAMRLPLASAYGWLCMARGPLQEGMSLFRAALNGDHSELDAPAYARALWGQGALAWRCGETDLCRRSHEECLAIARRVGDRRLVGRTLRALGILAAEELDVEASTSLLNEALAIFRELDDRDEVCECLNMLGYGAMVRRDYAAARPLMEEALAHSRAVSDPMGVLRCASNLAFVASEEGRFAEALELAREALVIADDIADVRSVGGVLAELAYIAVEQGSVERSAVLQGGAEALYELTESSFDPPEARRKEWIREKVARELGSDRRDELFAEGRAETVDRLVARALSAE